jgi:hypothetical protein
MHLQGKVVNFSTFSLLLPVGVSLHQIIHYFIICFKPNMLQFAFKPNIHVKPLHIATGMHDTKCIFLVVFFVLQDK